MKLGPCALATALSAELIMQINEEEDRILAVSQSTSRNAMSRSDKAAQFPAAMVTLSINSEGVMAYCHRRVHVLRELDGRLMAMSDILRDISP